MLCDAKSDVGLKRSTNEDRFLVDREGGLYVVCDGMGGQEGGEVASQLTIEAIRQYEPVASGSDAHDVIGMYDQGFSPQTNRLASAVRRANHVVYQEAQSRPEYRGMGTTVVAALMQGPIVSIAHVGDSRLYLIRGKSIVPLTSDHSLVAEQVRSGMLTEEQARRSSQRHMLTRAVGIGPTVDVELGEVPVRTHDILLLCSDGLTREIEPPELLCTIRDTHDLTAASTCLIDMANARGGEDNTTVVLVAVQPSTASGFWHRMLRPFINGARINASS